MVCEVSEVAGATASPSPIYEYAIYAICLTYCAGYGETSLARRRATPEKLRVRSLIKDCVVLLLLLLCEYVYRTNVKHEV